MKLSRYEMKMGNAMKFTKKIFSGILLACILMLTVPAVAEKNALLAGVSEYDGRKFGIITPVRDQGSGTTLCWAYAAANASEAFLVKSGLAQVSAVKPFVLLPTQIGYACNNRGADPLGNVAAVSTGKNYLTAEGQSVYAAALFSQWCGPVDADMPIDRDGWQNSEYRMSESLYLNFEDLNTNAQSRLELKNAIVKYGAVTFSYNNARNAEYYNPTNETGAQSYPHACTIIGWRDDIPAESFLPGGATQNGGWLIKNSYSDLPYFYLSYDVTSSNACTFAFEKKSKYDGNYFYDSDVYNFGLGAILMPKTAANIFEAKMGSESQTECVSAVNVGISGKNEDATITVKIYKDIKDNLDPTSGALASAESFEVKYPGYHTLELATPVEIEKGSFFSVVAEITNGKNMYFGMTKNSGMSFVSRGGTLAAASAPRVKAFTKLVGEKISVFDTEVWLDADENGDGVFVLAEYDGECLKDMRVYHTSDKINRFEIPENWERGKNCKIKCMFFRSLWNMLPIYTAEVC